MGILSKFVDGIDSVAFFVLLSSAVRIALAWSGRKRLVGHVSRLFLYPVKSMGGIEVDQLECLVPGPQTNRFGDRHFVVIKGDENAAVTARAEPTMLLIKTSFGDGKLYLDAENEDSLVVDLRQVEAQKKVLKGTVHGNDVVGLDCGDKTAAWLDKFLKKPGHRLLFCSPSVDMRTIRNGVTKYLAWNTGVNKEDKMAYQDSSTYHILSQSSVDDLNSRIGEGATSVSIHNYRPNIVVSEAAPYAEDSWIRVFIGDAEFSFIKLCGRCLLTTIDPETVKIDNKSLATLRSYRKLVPSFEDSPCLGVNLTLNKCGTIHVGDPIYAVHGPPKLLP